MDPTAVFRRCGYCAHWSLSNPGEARLSWVQPAMDVGRCGHYDKATLRGQGQACPRFTREPGSDDDAGE